MTKRLYIVFDKVANMVVGGIVQQAHDAPAIRTFHDTLANKEGPFNAHAEDYELLHIGSMTDAGEITEALHELLPIVVATGTQWAAGNNQQR